MFETAWSGASEKTIYAYGKNGGAVTLARFAHDFSAIDDPDALPYNDHVISVDLNEIVIFRNGAGAHLLVKVLEIHAGPERGAEHYELRAAFKLASYDPL